MARRRKGEETRQRILAAALKLFGAKGYAGTSTRAIAREAGVAEGTIFHYFSSKYELLRCVLEPLMLDSIATTTRTENQGLPIEQALQRILRQRLAIVEQNQDLFKVLLLEAAVQPELRQHLLSEVILPLRAAALEFLQEMLPGELSTVQKTALVQLLLGSLLSTMLYKHLLKPALPAEPETEVIIPAMVDLITKGMKGVKVNA